MMKILNLYAGIGGNRKLWGDEHEVTAIEIEPEIARIYEDLFPNDTVICTDAHQYLLDHYKEFDLIWSSPPCPTHSVCNHFLNAQGVIRYPDMSLWQEIVFLKAFCKKGLWVIENVRSYYDPLIEPQYAGRHAFWSNFKIPHIKIECKFNIANMRASTRKTNEDILRSLENFHGYDMSKYEGKVKGIRKMLRNCVKPELGLYILNCALKKPEGNATL